MDLQYNVTLRNSIMTALKAAIDAGGAAGSAKAYTLPLPATTGAAITSQTLLATCALSYPCGTVSAGALTFGAIADEATAPASGDMAFIRILSSTGDFVLDAGIGLTGSGKIFTANTLTVIAGGIVRGISAVLTEGNP